MADTENQLNHGGVESIIKKCSKNSGTTFVFFQPASKQSLKPYFSHWRLWILIIGFGFTLRFLGFGL